MIVSACTNNFASEEQLLYEHLVDALHALFGAHPGYRAIHAKGIVGEGTFSPAAVRRNSLT